MSDATSSLGSSLTWEKVSLSPMELLALRLEAELKRAEQAREDAKRARQNKLGVDLNTDSRRAAGKFSLQVLAVRGLAPLSADLEAQLSPTAYVSAMVTPVSACEKTVKKHLRTQPAPLVRGAASWQETLAYDGVKSRQFAVRVAVNRASNVLADVVVGEAELLSDRFLDQRTHELWLQLRPSASLAGGAPSSAACGELLVRVTFEYYAVARLDASVAAIRARQQENDADMEVFRQNAPLLGVVARHPAAFGSGPVKAALYIPSSRFRADVHHPAAVQVAPLADKTRVVTPFGHGAVVSFRPETKMYVVQLDADAASKNPTTAFLRQADVKEEPAEPRFRMHMKVATPYGRGSLEEIRPRDGVMVVRTDYATLFMQPKDVAVPPKSVAEMTNKDLIEEAVKLADEGNALFRAGALDEANLSYLRALGFVQRVDQEMATHKEKATVLQTMIRCHLNLAASKLRQDAHMDAEIASTNALSILTVLSDNRSGNVVTWMGRLGMSDQLLFEDWPSKARFRRAQARTKLGKYMDAKQDLVVAAKLSPKDKSCRALLEQVSKLVEKQKREEKKAWGGIFESIEGDKEVTPETIVQANREKERASPSPQDSSIFTRKRKSQRQRDAEPAPEPWYASTATLAAASVVTAGLAAVALLALRPRNS